MKIIKEVKMKIRQLNTRIQMEKKRGFSVVVYEHVTKHVANVRNGIYIDISHVTTLHQDWIRG